jgi:hypothetical protein
MDRRAALVALAAAALVWAILAAPLLSGEVYTFNDLGLAHLPIRAFYARCLAVGDSFLWWPDEFTGVYLHGEGQGGLLHPLQWLSYRFLPLAVAFQLELLRAPLLALAGTYLLLRRWRLDASAALLGAIAAAFSGFALLHYMHPNLTGVWAQLPWLLLCIHTLLAGASGARRALAFGGIVLLVASQLLLGHPQGVWLSLLVEVPYALLLAVRSRGLALLPLVALAELLGAGAAGVQLLPTFESFSLSSRAAVGPGFAATPALAAADLVQLVGPYLYATRVAEGIPWERSAWPGAVPLVLAMWLLLRGRALERGRALACFGLALAMAGLWLALGDAAGLYRLERALPGFGSLRAPARHVALFQFGLALSAAVAFHDLLHLEAPPGWRRRWLLFAPGLLGVVCLVVAVAREGGSASLLSASPLALAAGPLLLLAAAACVAAWGRARGAALAALVALATLDLGTYGLSFVRAHPPETIAAFLARHPAPPVAAGQRVLGGSPALSMRVPLANGYLALVPERQIPLDTPAALRLANVGFAFGRVLPDPLPRARLLSRVRVSQAPARDLASLDLAAEALVDRDPGLPSFEGGEAGRARVVRDRPGEISIATEARGRRLLVLSESHHPGWRAEVDGGPCALLRVNGDYLGCVVPAGDHEVVFRFAPASLRRGAWLSAASLAVASLFCVWLGRGRRGGAVGPAP